MKYLSVCSGIEAATSAWHHLGWEPVAFSEIEPFPSAVLKHHYPNVPNWGDMTQYKNWPDATIDLLVGGTPCQSFSVAGLRKGLEDPRGNLMLTFLGIADRYRPKYIVWENVPGVLSSNGGKDFGSFLGALGELGYGWAYRVLDAQWFGVAQRRRRVFVVGCLGDQRRAAEVLFESESVSRNTPPSRAKGQGATADAQGSVGSSSAHAFKVRGGCEGGGKGYLGSDDTAFTVATHQDQQIYFGFDGDVPKDQTLSETISTREGGITDTAHAVAQPVAGFLPKQGSRAEGIGYAEEQSPTLRAGCDSYGIIQPVAFAQNVRDEVRLQNGDGQIVGALSAESGMHQTSYIAQPLPFDTTQLTCPSNYSSPKPGDPCHPLAAGAHTPAVAYDADLSQVLTTHEVVGSLCAESGPNTHGSRGVSGTQTMLQGYIQPTLNMQVRRLTPVECERLQGFPDNHTNIPWRKKAEAPDGPRYKALGNSMAVPVMRWIGERINA
jgi:DNA (cytosine-5)-methyltransferase 1